MQEEVCNVQNRGMCSIKCRVFACSSERIRLESFENLQERRNCHDKAMKNVPGFQIRKSIISGGFSSFFFLSSTLDSY